MGALILVIEAPGPMGDARGPRAANASFQMLGVAGSICSRASFA
jgi:hypothetical protein